MSLPHNMCVCVCHKVSQDRSVDGTYESELDR